MDGGDDEDDGGEAEDKEIRELICFPCIKASSLHADTDKGVGRTKPGLLARYMKVLTISLNWLYISIFDFTFLFRVINKLFGCIIN